MCVVSKLVQFGSEMLTWAMVQDPPAYGELGSFEVFPGRADRVVVAFKLGKVRCVWSAVYVLLVPRNAWLTWHEHVLKWMTQTGCF